MSSEVIETCKQIIETDYSEYRTAPIKFATNWHIYLVGDKYEDNYEFEEMAKTIPSNKITYINLPIAPERETLKGDNLHAVGGVNSFNYAHKLALDDKCDYLLHLDDDDSWSPKKIQVLNYVAKQFNNPEFMFHYSTYINKGALPREQVNEIHINNLLPEPANCIHSSYCAHKSLMSGFQYSSKPMGYTPEGVLKYYVAGDIQFLWHFNNYFKLNNGACVFIPFLLSAHDTELEAISLTPKKEYEFLSFLEKMTPISSTIVKRIADTMKGNTFHHHFHILYSLRDLIQKETAVYTEIGTFNGGSMCLMLQHPKNTEVVSIDPFHLERTNKRIVQENISNFNVHSRKVKLTEQFSNNPAFLQQLKEENFTTDILFIDGDHSYNAVLEDFYNFKDFINPDGFIVFDDYHDAQYSPEVRPAVDAIMKEIVNKKLPFRIVGNPFNFCSVYPQEFKFMNEFIIQRI
jgi:predicted O-methyltransferase YrrM